MTKIAAIIPARGGSKGIPRKNLRIVGGKPLISWSISAAKSSKFIDKIVVSTDDDEIAMVSKKYGAEVVMRPKNISGDNSKSEDALVHTLKTLQENWYVPDIVVFLQCTSPLTSAADIDSAIETLGREEADCCFTAIPFHHFLWKTSKNGEALAINHDAKVRLMRQDVDLQMLETGAVYVMKADGFLKARHRFFGKICAHQTSPDRYCDIDTADDLATVEAKISNLSRQSSKMELPEPIEAVFFDFDGVFTDNQVWLSSDGEETVKCSRADGLGIDLLKRTEIPIMVLSSEKNPVVKVRCDKLGIPVIHGVPDKLKALKEWVLSNRKNMKNVIYVGNDLNDLECLKAVGYGVAVADAFPEVKSAARLILKNKGGEGAVRELINIILEKGGLKS